ncbi:MAG TPA: hypothetical protein VEI96_13265 [Thermodesulfovibrionales bacterium]|nr:hypothetical protein [Thermodesulfovibrionales bacterium]
MTEKERPLPKPPSSAFGGRRRHEEVEGEPPLMADQMFAAVAEGKIEEFLQREMPDNEHARTLAMMMMGMSGMLPPPGLPSAQREEIGEEAGKSRIGAAAQEPSSGVQPPEEVLKAIESGDVKGLMGLLEREQEKRNPDTGNRVAAAKGTEDSLGLSGVEKEVIDRLIEIASENNLTLDWIVLRALRLYAEEYGKTGRL